MSGCEAAVHAMHQVYEDGDTDGVILVDATNAFNCINRQTALININNLCPALSKVLINTYRQYIPLFIDGESTVQRWDHTRRSLGNGSVCCCHDTTDLSPILKRN